MSAARFYYTDALNDISKELNNMVKKGKNVDGVLNEVGEVWYHALYTELSKHVSKKTHVHMRDDIVTNVKTSKKGNRYVSVHGGKETGWKWHIINDGHLANNFEKGKLKRRDGYKTAKGMKASWVPGTKFMDIAVSSTSRVVDFIVDEFVKDVAE